MDRSLTPTDGRIVVAAVDGEVTLKRLCCRDDGVYLVPENLGYQAIEVTENRDVLIWGVVAHVVHSL